MRKRPELVAAALTVERAYLSAGAPNRASPMGGFEDWSDLVRSSLIWLGLADCRGDVAAQRAADPEKDELAEIIEALPNGPFTTREIALRVADSPLLREALGGFIERSGAFSSGSGSIWRDMPQRGSAVDGLSNCPVRATATALFGAWPARVTIIRRRRLAVRNRS
ncbi:hypothetical protein [Mesorhizobium sp. M0040]|uniref:hypothetical protein n=1 Tax=Mesorhizobium sp. M0040 TaxID=2956855 RepID=UPI00333DD261